MTEKTHQQHLEDSIENLLNTVEGFECTCKPNATIENGGMCNRCLFLEKWDAANTEMVIDNSMTLHMVPKDDED